MCSFISLNVVKLLSSECMDTTLCVIDQGHSSAAGVVRHRSVRQAGVMLPGSEPVRDMWFHRLRGASNMSLSADGLTASLIHASHNTDTASVTCCRPLHDDELFEFRVDRVITMPSSASLEAGRCLQQSNIVIN